MTIATVAVPSGSDYRGAWTIQVTGEWGASAAAFGSSLGAHPDFPVMPLTSRGSQDGPSKVVLTVTGQGYTRSGGQAVATTYSRTIVATKVLRKPVPDSAEGSPVLDEVDNGDGTRTVWLALSEPIFAGESVTASFEADWRTGQPAAANVPVTNNSDRVRPIPAARWAVPQWMPVIGKTTQRVDLIVASHFAQHFGALANQAVAAVRFDVTDTVNTNSVWVTGESVSDLFNDNLRCWGAVIDCTGLNPGGVQVTAEIFPWQGESRVIGTMLLTTQSSAWDLKADIPLGLAYDPDGSFFQRKAVYVDAVTGSTDPASITVADVEDLASARLAPAASVSEAMEAFRQKTNRILPAANGFSSTTYKNAPYFEIVLAPGVQVIGTQAVTFGFSGAGIGYTIIRGDPEDPNPRANCILRSGAAAAPSLRSSFFKLEDLSLELGDVPLLGVGRVWVDRVTARRKVGAASATAFFQASPFAGTIGGLFATDYNWVDYTNTYDSGSLRPILLRSGLVGNSTFRPTSAKALINLTAVPKTGQDYSGINTGFEFENWTNLEETRATDHIIWGCKSLTTANSFYNQGMSPGSPSAAVRTVMVNNLCVRGGSGAASQQNTVHLKIGESSSTAFRDCILENNSIIGARCNWHDDGPSGSIRHHSNRVANNYWDWQPTKHDYFSGSGANIQSWEKLYGCWHHGNVHGERDTTASSFTHEFYGAGSYRNLGDFGPGVSIAAFVDDQSEWGPNAVNGVGPGGGDYTPGVGSALLDRAVASSTAVDGQGNPRGLLFDSGAVEAVGQATEASLAPDAASHGHVASIVDVTAWGRVRPADGAVSIASTAPVVTGLGPPPPPPPPSDGGSQRIVRVRASDRTLVPDGR